MARNNNSKIICKFVMAEFPASNDMFIEHREKPLKLTVIMITLRLV